MILSFIAIISKTIYCPAKFVTVTNLQRDGWIAMVVAESHPSKQIQFCPIIALRGDKH